MQRILAPILLAVLWAGGCAQTVSAERFLYVYRLSAPPGHDEEGWRANYTGRDEQYHYLEVRHSTLKRGAGAMLLYGGYRDETLRCRREELPFDFPDSFSLLYQEDRPHERDEETRRYVREYLEQYGLGPSDRTTQHPRTQPAGQHR
ncbi:MAG TPA: hypothetical protein VNA25_30945 [Phycisphaerae bacterium]|nr:hypothetical protein [Phycisphaerae bacterium]